MPSHWVGQSAAVTSGQTFAGRRLLPAGARTGVASWSLKGQPWPRYFGPALALYIAIALSRLNEIVPHLDRLYPGKVAAILVIGAAMVDMRSLDVSRAFQSTLAKCIGVITILAVLSVPGSAWPRQSVTFFQNQWPQTLLMFFGILIGFSNRRTAYVAIVAATVTAALGALELVAGAGLSNQGRAYIGGGGSSTYDPNASAALFVMLVPYAVFLATRRGKLRVPAMIMIPIFIAAMVKTASRGGVVALGALGVALIVFAPKPRRLTYASLFFAMLMTLYFVPHSGLAERLSELSGSQDYNFTSRDGRLEIWKRGIGMMLSHPAFGVGVRAYEVANGNLAHSWMNAHNAIVQIGAELGIGGLAAFVVAVVVAFQAALGLVRRTRGVPQAARDAMSDFDRGMATAAMCSLVAELCAAMFLSMAYDNMTLFALAVPTSLALATSPRTALAGNAVRGGPSTQPLQPGWRSARRVPSRLPPVTPKPQM